MKEKLGDLNNNTERKETNQKYKGLLEHVWDSLDEIPDWDALKDDPDYHKLPNYENFEFNRVTKDKDNQYFIFLEGEDKVEVTVQIPNDYTGEEDIEDIYLCQIWKNNELMYEE